MRAAHIALAAAILAFPSASYPQDQGLVDGRVGPGLESSMSSPQTGSSSSWSQPYGVRPRAPQEHPGYSGTVSPGQVANPGTPIVPRPDGTATAFVNGRSVIVEPGSMRILRILN